MEDIWVIIGLLLTNAGFLFGMWKHFDGRIGRVFERFDEHKHTVEGLYVRKDSCTLLHNNTADNLKNLELRILAQFDKIEKKMDDWSKLVMDLLQKK